MEGEEGEEEGGGGGEVREEGEEEGEEEGRGGTMVPCPEPSRSSALKVTT
jgi:hypothetical protein